MVLGIYGSGGAGKETKEIAEILNTWSEIVFIDDTVEADLFKGVRRMPWKNFCDKFSNTEAEIVISLGEPEYKVKMREKVEKEGFKLANVIHPTAWISPSAKIGLGVILRAGVIIQADAIVGNNVTIMEYAGVGHDSVVGNNTQIAACVSIGGHCKIGENVYIATSVPVKDRVSIGSDSIIGMGAVVSRDVDENVIALGNPARAMKKKDDSKVF